MLSLTTKVLSQCAQFYDSRGDLSSNPRWVHCFPTDYTLNLAPSSGIASYTIDWGDGTANTTGTSLNPPDVVSHVYAASTAVYNVVITQTSNGCTTNGTVVMEEFVNASIQIPVGGATQICAPGSMEFINASTNVSPTTQFSWDFGDGSPVQFFDHTNFGVVMSHMYQTNTVQCETEVTLTAENFCSNGVPTEATFNPALIWDYDDARIDASATVLCYPDTEVFVQNAPLKNCINFGNTAQRYEYWNFGDYWSPGQDLIVDWAPYDPPAQPGHNLAFPGLGTYTISIRDSNYCGIDDASVTINIIERPEAIVSSDKDTICAGETVRFFNNSINGANSFGWNFGDGSQAGGGGTKSKVYDTPGIYFIELRAGNNAAPTACNDYDTVKLVVLASPVIDVDLSDNEACDSLLVSITNNTTGSTSSEWTFGNGETSNLNNPPAQFYSTQGEYDIILIANGPNNCTSTDTQKVSIYISPIVDYVPNNVCVDAVAELIDASVTSPSDTITSWFWDFGDGTTSVLENPTHQYSSSQTYDIIHSVSTANCTSIDTFELLVEAKPDVSFTIPDSIGCNPLAASIINTSSTSAVSFIWSFGDGDSSLQANPTHIFNNSSSTLDSTYYVSLYAATSFGCSDTASGQVTVLYNPDASFVTNSTFDCAPLAVEFENQSTGAISYVWDFGNGDSVSTVNSSYTFENQTLFINNNPVELTAVGPNGCTDKYTQDVIVYPEPIFTFSAVPISGCSPLEVQFPSVVGAVSYEWSFGDGSTAIGPTPSHTYVNLTTNNVAYDVQLIAESPFGCKDTTVEQVNVLPKPFANFSLDKTAGCEPLVLSIQNTSTGAVSFDWDFNNGDTSFVPSANFTYTYENVSFTSLDQEITLVVESQDGCRDTSSQLVTIYPKVIASFISDSSGCAPLSMEFLNVSQGASNYLWNFGDGQQSNEINPVNLFSNNTSSDLIFTTQLIASNTFGCSDTASKNIDVFYKPVANFNTNVLAGCQPLLVNIQNTSQGGDSYNWNFGDGTTSTDSVVSLSHIYSNSGMGSVFNNLELITSTNSGCKDTSTNTIEVYPGVVASFSGDTAGCSIFTANYINTTEGATSYMWNFGDNNQSIEQNPQHDFSNFGLTDVTYNVSMIGQSSFGCSDTAYSIFTVYPSPNASFVATPTTQQFPSAIVNIINNSSSGNWSYLWDFGNGVTDTVLSPNVISYDTWGNYTLKLEVFSDNCSDEVQTQIIINPPVPTVKFSGSGDGCRPLTVEFENESLNADSYVWNFGDGGSSVATNPTYTYYNPGTYTVQLTATGFGGDVSTFFNIDSVIVRENALAAFSHAPTEVSIPNEPVQFLNLSTFASTYSWDFGDGNISTEQSPTHLYTEAGVYDVVLVANNEYDCIDSFTVQNAVIAKINGDIIFPNAFTPNSAGPSGGNVVPNSLNNDIFYPLTEGIAEYHLMIFNRWGEMVFESFDRNIGWDGYYRNKLAKQDVYVWKVEATFINGENYSKSGDVTLIR